MSQTKVSSEYSTVIPAQIRKALHIEPGDLLVWNIEGDGLRIRPRKKENLKNLIGLISSGGNAVEAKKRIQGGTK